MSKKQHYYYILVFEVDGPAYVTGTIYENRCAEWHKDEVPKEFTKTIAKDICLGLNLNGFSSVVVDSFYKIDHQPYMYEMGCFEWKKEEAKNEK